MTQSELTFLREALSAKVVALLETIASEHNELVALKAEQAKKKEEPKTTKKESK